MPICVLYRRGDVRSWPDPVFSESVSRYFTVRHPVSALLTDRDVDCWRGTVSQEDTFHLQHRVPQSINHR